MLKVNYYAGVPDVDGDPTGWGGCSLCTRPLAGPLIRMGSRKQTRWFHRMCLEKVVDESFVVHPEEGVTEWERKRRERRDRLQRAEAIVAEYRESIVKRERSRRSHPSACSNTKERDPAVGSRS